MKKKIFGALLVVAIATGAMMNVNLNKVSNRGDLAMANVEALAQSEGGSITCSQTCNGAGRCWKSTYYAEYGAYYCKATGDPQNTCHC